MRRWRCECVCAFFSFAFISRRHISICGHRHQHQQYTPHTYIVHTRESCRVCVYGDPSLGHEKIALRWDDVCVCMCVSKRCWSIHLIARAATATTRSPRISHSSRHLPPSRNSNTRTHAIRPASNFLCTRQAHTSKLEESENKRKKKKRRIEKCVGKFHVDKWNKFFLLIRPFGVIEGQAAATHRSRFSNPIHPNTSSAAKHIQRDGNVFFTHTCFSSGGVEKTRRSNCNGSSSYGRENGGARNGYLSREK